MNDRANSSAAAFRSTPPAVVFSSARQETGRAVRSKGKPGRTRTLIAGCSVAIALLLSSTWPAEAQTAAIRFIPTFLVYYGGGPTLTAADAPALGKFDMIDIDRFRYTDIGSQTWAAIKAVNPNSQIYLYVDGVEVENQNDATAQLYLNNLGRYDVSRAHPMGSVNGNHPEYFQRDAAGNRIYNAWFSNTGANSYYYLLDFGASSYQSYWL